MIRLRAFAPADIPAALALWQRTDGIGLNESDTPEALARFLARNPGLGAVAENERGELIGAVLCGHDGRRGYLHHLAVEPSHRRAGLGRRLVARCFERLAAEGIPKCNLFVFEDNHAGVEFWLRDGWKKPEWSPLQKRVPLGGEEERT